MTLPSDAEGVDPYDPALSPIVTEFGRRLVARLVDVAVLVVLVGLVLSPWSEQADNGDLRVDAPVGVVVAVVLGALAYEIVPVWLAGRTLGKSLARVRVVANADAPLGRRPGLGQAVRRTLVPALPAIAVGLVPAVRPLAPPVFTFLVATALLRPDGRGLPDRLAGTRVLVPRRGDTQA